MRDPARIPRIMNKLTTVWSDAPELRFGQLLYAIKYTEEKQTVYDEPLMHDIFHHEDDRLEECLDDYLLAYNTQSDQN